MKASKGLRNALLVSDSLKTVMALGFIHIYAGTVPATADDALGSATLLCTISESDTGTGITFDDNVVAPGVAQKNTGEVWSGTNVDSGTATFFRHVAVGDDGTSSVVQPRLQGTVAVGGGDLNLLPNTVLTSGAGQDIDYYTVALPTL
ncbi:hypothetical protein [Polaromonas sp.]|uniref:hypothetical protein n=1 Tax=Polaromonas sp. TaxID=1869339 RepID=UPI0032644F53